MKINQSIRQRAAAKSLHRIFAVLASMLFATSMHAATWTAQAKKLFEDDNYEACIQLTEKYSKDNQATMFLAFSYLQQSVFSQSKLDKEKFKAYQTKLETSLGVDDMNDLLYFVKLTDKPYVVKEARALTKDVFKNMHEIDDVPKLLVFLKVEDEDTRKLTLSTIERILKPKRDYVNKGGSLRDKDYDVMNSPTVIKALVEQLPLSDAKSSLILIEEPALAYLTGSDDVEAVKLEVAINKKIAARQKKFPNSNWHSATGKKR